MHLFTIIKRILTLENTKNLNDKYITLDFEKGLIIANISLFPGIKLIECFYLFFRAIKENFKRFHRIDKKECDTILNDIFNLLFSFSSENYTNVDVLTIKKNTIDVLN